MRHASNILLRILLSATLLMLGSTLGEAADDKSGGVWVEAEGVFNLGDETTMELAQRASLETAKMRSLPAR